ncbi:MAG: CHRD domain-containing protein [Thaumarchaeota archaeon]|nr:CHRD domain-containing protein [Nitrososphaerota archaeon]
MSNRKLYAALAAATIFGSLLAAVGFSVSAEPQTRDFKADLNGFNEAPAVSTTGTGTFRAKLSQDEMSIEYELSYSGLEGTTTLAAHIHFGQKNVAGGVSAFLCGGGGKPDCTPTSGSVSGTITADDVIGPTAQGIAAGEFNELLRAMRGGLTYANVHSNKHPGGEIRGQIND